MRILFDQGVPAPLRGFLEGHTVATAYETGWAALKNGELLLSAEGQFDALITTDQSLRHPAEAHGAPLGDPCATDNQLAQDPGARGRGRGSDLWLTAR